MNVTAIGGMTNGEITVEQIMNAREPPITTKAKKGFNLEIASANNRIKFAKSGQVSTKSGREPMAMQLCRPDNWTATNQT